LKRLYSVALVLVAAVCLLAGEGAKLAGTWQMSFESPHGPMTANLHIQQDGSKLTGTFDVEHMGSMPLAGSVDGGKVSMKVEVPGQKLTLTFNGEIDGDKMSGTMTPRDSAWKATRQ